MNNIEYLRITEKTEKWFLPLLPAEEQQVLHAGSGCYAIGAVADKEACGVLVFDASDEIIEIRYLAVSVPFRRQGIATGMIRMLCKSVSEEVIPVRCVFPAADKEDPLYLLFAEMPDFSVSEEEGFICRIPYAEVKEAESLLRLRGRCGTVKTFFELPPMDQKKFFLNLYNQGIYYLREISEKDYVKPLCRYLADKNGKIEAAVFLAEKKGQDEENAAEKELELSFVWSAPGQESRMLCLLAEVSALLPEKGNLWISAVTKTTAAIVDKLFPKHEVTERFYSGVWDLEI